MLRRHRDRLIAGLRYRIGDGRQIRRLADVLDAIDGAARGKRNEAAQERNLFENGEHGLSFF
jgi:hypothetical protein